MKNLKSSIFYVGIIGSFTALMYWIAILGTKQEAGRNVIVNAPKGQWEAFTESFMHNIQHPLALLLAQIITIILVAKLFGWICTKIGQPSVIGEMIAGIVLGPSLFGLFYPELSAMIFPKESLPNLQFLSQIGLILFMFIVGMELDLSVLKKTTHNAVVVSHASIIIPFAMGMGLAYYIYGTFAPDGVQFISFGLFMGIAMSITAFPVLARIVQERGITKTKLGTLVIACAAADDITAWCILAAVIAVVKAGSVVSSFYTILMAAAYVIIMLKLVRPFLARIGNIYTSKQTLTKPIVAIFFLTLIISSYLTEAIGIHALFGAFMAGAIMPDNIKFRTLFIEKVEDVSLTLLLPLFFVFTGLRTQIGLLSEPGLWKLTAIIIVVAVTGKFIGSAVAAKFVGQNWKDSLSIGALMNTRGLMELVVLNIGYDLGVLTPTVFSMMVLMALITTFMTGPALDIINWAFKSKLEEIPIEISQANKFKVLISFANPERGKSLLRLAHSLIKKLNGNAAVTAMYLTPTNELHHFDVEQHEKESFLPVVEESESLNQKITTLFKASNDIDSDITEVANRGDYDLLLVGVGKSIFEGSLLGKILGFTTRIINPEKLLNQVTGKESLFENSPFDESTSAILNKSKVPVGVLIDKDFASADKVFIPVFSDKDAFLIKFAQKLIKNSESQIILLDVMGHIKNNPELKEKIRTIEQIAPNHISVLSDKMIDKELLSQQELMLVSMESWKKLVDSKSLWLSNIPSTLILKESI